MFKNFHLDNMPEKLLSRQYTQNHKKQVSSTYATLKKRCIKIVDT